MFLSNIFYTLTRGKASKITFFGFSQTVSCKIEFAHVRKHSHLCDMCAKTILKCSCNVHAMCLCAALFPPCNEHLHFRNLLHIFCDKNGHIWSEVMSFFNTFQVGWCYSHLSNKRGAHAYRF